MQTKEGINANEGKEKMNENLKNNSKKKVETR
jgi:hypothetical protein